MLTNKVVCTNAFKSTRQAIVYRDDQLIQKSVVLYFHGGGLIYGSNDDLPSLHIEKLTSSGYTIISFDYPLAPPSSIDEIVSDVIDSVNTYINFPETFGCQKLPYILWGRSAGAYLCLLALASDGLVESPIGAISYYGYGLFPKDWIFSKSLHYLSLPNVQSTNFKSLSNAKRRITSVDDGFPLYVYGRQQGIWAEIISNTTSETFLKKYSLRKAKDLPCPLFMAHSLHDTDVPFDEFLEISKKYNAKKYISTALGHDFDRDTANPQTLRLINATIKFLNEL